MLKPTASTGSSISIPTEADDNMKVELGLRSTEIPLKVRQEE
jgi:hypothetical protein